MRKSPLFLLFLFIITYSTYAQNIFPESGYVGIGTNTPGNRLTVRDAIRVSTGDGWGGFYAYDASIDGNSIFSLSRQGNNLNLSSWDGIGFATGKHSGPSTAYNMFIDITGKVGIGTITPYANLHLLSGGSYLNTISEYSGDLIIQGNSGSRNSVSGASLEFVIPANADGSNPWGQARIITVANNNESSNATGKMILGTRRTMDKMLGDGNQWYYGNDLVIDGAGHIGIGTLNPKEALSVNGNIRAQEIKVETSGWPDYVFKPSYILPTLNEVKLYIDKNQHLPDMPSEKEVASNGINLGEMNKLLTKKIEELTLYLIEKDKIINDEQKTNSKQEQRIGKLETQLKDLIESLKSNLHPVKNK